MRACSVSGTSSARRRPAGGSLSPSCSSRPRSSSMRTVSTGVERHALGALEDPVAKRRPAGRGRAVEQLVSIASAERLEGERREVRRAGAPARMALRQLGRASVSTKIGWLRDHSSRYSTNSSSAASAHCMSSKTIGSRAAARPWRSKKSRQPRRGPPGPDPLLEAEQVRQPRLDPARSSVGDQVSTRRRASAAPRRDRPRAMSARAEPSRRAPSR